MGREFVFVHGMRHAGWCWDPIVERLERRGHRRLAVDLPSHGRRAHGGAPGPGADYAARLGVKPIDLDTVHDPMLSDPDALVAILERI